MKMHLINTLSRQQKRPYYKELAFLKGFTILIVLLGHSILVYPIDLSNIPWCTYLSNYIYSYHMRLLFFLSGFFYAIGSTKSYLEIVVSKFRRLMIPFLVFNLTTLIVKIGFSDLVNKKIDNVETYFFNILGGGSLWFLHTLFIIFLIYPVIQKLFKFKHFQYYLIIFLLLLIATEPFRLIWDDPFNLKSVFYHMLYFHLGFLAQQFYVPNIRRLFGLKTTFLCCLALFLTFNHIEDSLNFCTRLLLPLIGISLSLSFAIQFHERFNNRIWTLADKYSLQLYLLDGYMLVPLRHVMIQVLHIRAAYILVPALLTIKVFLILILSSLLLSKFKLTRFLTGITAGKNRKYSGMSPVYSG